MSCRDMDYLVFSERSCAVPPPEPLLLDHLNNAFESVESAFKEDPLRVYKKAGGKWSSFRTSLYKRIWRLRRRLDMKNKLAYVVNAGDAIVVATLPEDVKKPSRADRVLDFILGAIVLVVAVDPLNAEQVKRLKESQTKLVKSIRDELGERTKEMFYVDFLATKPSQQGHGFGTALMDTILSTVDIRGRSTYLLSSNVANVPYYESFGFVRIADVVLGDSNPKWKNPPVIVPLMVREARGHD